MAKSPLKYKKTFWVHSNFVKKKYETNPLKEGSLEKPVTSR